MKRVLHLIAKESLLLLRDWHALLLLFLMPAIFILVMSLALQGKFSAQSGVQVGFYLVSHDVGKINEELLRRLRSMKGFVATSASAPITSLKAQVRRGDKKFLLIVPEGFGAALSQGNPKPLRLVATPDVPATVYQLFQARLREELGQLYLAQRNPVLAASTQAGVGQKLLSAHSLYGSENSPGSPRFPTSVQQNVPAWLLFAMFFIAIPLSTTWVQERQQGTYARLRSMGVGAPVLLAGKLLPYIVINLLQVVLMLLVGVFVVPWLGGGQLGLGHAWGALALMSWVASFAAVSYALLIANLVTTSEQATIFTGVANLLMAALGGIMVPRFVMPPLMQEISQFSPMAWGLDGFLDIFLRGGGVGMMWVEALKLSLFGVVCLLITAAWMHWRGRR